jgi:hypothetical protein
MPTSARDFVMPLEDARGVPARGMRATYSSAHELREETRMAKNLRATRATQ